MMQAVGLWITGIDDETYPAPQEVVGELPASDKHRLIDYLRTGRVQGSCLGYSWCRFGCGIADQLMGSRDLTDGAWVWPEGLAHYVSDHGITLPERFVRHALSSAHSEGQTGDLIQQGDFSDTEEVDVSDTDWIEWASTRRWPQVLERLKEAQRRAAAFYETERDKEVAQLEKQHGLSPERCVWRDCRRHALAHKHVCAEHCLGLTAEFAYGSRATEELHTILRDLTQAHGQVADFRCARGPNAQHGECKGGTLRRLLRRVLRS